MSYAEFLFFESFLFSLVLSCSLFFVLSFLFSLVLKNENIKIPGFYTLLVTTFFSKFPHLKQLNKIKNLCEYCYLFELGSA